MFKTTRFKHNNQLAQCLNNLFTLVIYTEERFSPLIPRAYFVSTNLIEFNVNVSRVSDFRSNNKPRLNIKRDKII